MSRRTERVAKLLQQNIAQILLRQISDPRINPAMVSITRVEVADDFTRAKVYFSAMGTEAEQRTAERALRHASGRIQELMMEDISLRFTPILDFVPDVQFKKSLATLTLIQQAMEELRQRESAENPEEEPEDEASSEDEGQDA